LTQTVALGAENTPDGVKVRVRIKSGEQTLEARKVIAADGMRSSPTGSSIVESLGLNKKRQVLGRAPRGIGLVGYVLEGVETEYRLNSWLSFTIPDVCGTGDVYMYMLAGDRNGLCFVGRSEVLDKFMKLPFYEPWFRHARVVKKMATALGANYGPIMEPVADNVMIIGDAAAMVETTNPGAIACGYQAVKAIEKELNGQKGYPEYIKWWQEVIETNLPESHKAGARYFALNMVCSSEEIDYLYHLVQDQAGMPSILVAKNLEQIKGERPELYEKLKKTGVDDSVDKMKIDLL